MATTSRRPRPNKKCAACGKPFYAAPRVFDRRLYCSIACRYAAPGWQAPTTGAPSRLTPDDPAWQGSLPMALSLVEAQLATATGAEASLLEIERDALRWCLAHPRETRLGAGA